MSKVSLELCHEKGVYTAGLVACDLEQPLPFEDSRCIATAVMLLLLYCCS